MPQQHVNPHNPQCNWECDGFRMQLWQQAVAHANGRQVKLIKVEDFSRVDLEAALARLRRNFPSVPDMQAGDEMFVLHGDDRYTSWLAFLLLQPTRQQYLGATSDAFVVWGLFQQERRGKIVPLLGRPTSQSTAKLRAAAESLVRQRISPVPVRLLAGAIHPWVAVGNGADAPVTFVWPQLAPQ